MSSNSIRVAAGQVLVVGFPEKGPSEGLIELARAGSLGGFILFRRNLGSPEGAAELSARLRSYAAGGPIPWIAVDQEGGRVARLRAPVLTLPPARVFGDLDDLALTQEAASELGRQLAALGFNLDFAPVLDVDTNPENPVIGDRSYGRDVARVIRHARAFAAGLRAAGITACGKHFPGHGDTLLDSHLALPRVMHGEARLREVELAPFAALAGELPCIMTAHVVFDAWDPGVPATLSRRVVSGLLRTELGFEGLVFSDDLEMNAIASGYGMDDAACRAIEAGCDALLICSREDYIERAYTGLVTRAERDSVFAQRLGEAAARSIAARSAPLTKPLAPDAVAAALAAAPNAALEARFTRAPLV